jgi:antitoxin component YwqK of YwqJK toxin-antitoxin module
VFDSGNIKSQGYYKRGYRNGRWFYWGKYGEKETERRFWWWSWFWR